MSRTNQWHHLARAIRCVLLAGGVIGLSAPALAATAPGPAPGDQQQATRTGSTPDSTQKTPPKPADVTQLGGVQVTAQSRAQQAQDVPIALQIVDDQRIEAHAATDLSQMDMFIPGLVIGASQPTQPSYELRGIGGSGFGIGTDPAVGVYVDGVYSARSGAALLAFNDVKRIEVLKGPQGTLFGRNAAAGAISIITNEPSDKVEARARMRLGNYGERHADVLLNAPLEKNMALRLNVVDNQSQGWLRDNASGRHYGKNDDWGSRLSWRLDATDSTQLVVTWEHERLKQPPQSAISLIALSSDPSQRAPYPPDPNAYLDPLQAPLYNDAIEGRESRRYDNLSAHLYHYMDWGTLSSITSYRKFSTYNRGDYDGTNHISSYLDTANIESNRSLYQEFKLSGSSGMADWVGGVSWYKEDARQESQTNLFTNSIDSMFLNIGVPTGTPDGTLFHYLDQVFMANGVPFQLEGNPWGEGIRNHLKYSSTALYGDVIWHLTDRINLTTGARLTRDHKRFRWYNKPRVAAELDQIVDLLEQIGFWAQAGVDPAVFRQNIVFTDAVGLNVDHNDSWTDFSPRVVLDSHFNDNLMGYVSVAKGYKAGGYDSVQVGSEFEPEKVWNVEAGIKSVFPDQHLLLNASLYHYRYSNLQSLRLDPNTEGSGVPRYVADSSDQKANGAELGAEWRPLDGLTLHGNVAWIDSTYGHKLTPSGADISGQPTGIPKLSYALGLQYAWQVGSGRMAFTLDHAYRGAGRCNNDSALQGTCQISPNFAVNGSYTRSDARLGWTSADARWGVAAFVNNIADNRRVLGIDNISASVLGTPFAHISPPRMYGVEFQFNY
ncbi:MAG TPA: TonB-dependent receptor [Rhodanobacteraceae bacterium]|nr:TonB-dependent receptor [Rhodanobacteraceae bacterium]